MNNDWLENLKPGDKVIIVSNGFSRRMDLAVVDKITPKRRDIIVGNTVFDSRGYEKRSGYNRSSLIQPNEQHMAELKTFKESEQFSIYYCKLQNKVREMSHENKMKLLVLLKEIL